MSKYYINEHISSVDIDTAGIADDEVMTFYQSLNSYRETPLISLNNLAFKLGLRKLWVKDESNRMESNSFKILGVSYAVQRIFNNIPNISAVCTATEGNHGLAVARACRPLNIKTIVFVSNSTPENIINKIVEEGAIVEVVKGDYDTAVQIAHHKSVKNKWCLIQDTAWQDYMQVPSLIMSGYTAIFYEIDTCLQQKSEKIDLVLLQAGVGSFAGAAISYFLKHRYRKLKIVIVEPERADGCLSSAKNRKLIKSSGNGRSIMRGLNCKTPSIISLSGIINRTDVFLGIPDHYAKIAVDTLSNPIGDDRLIATKEAGAAGLAGLLAILNDEQLTEVKQKLQITKNTSVLIINTEGSE